MKGYTAEKHSFDILLQNILCCFWFNPLFGYTGTIQNLEYIADQKQSKILQKKRIK
jgi:hypothetical protein